MIRNFVRIIGIKSHVRKRDSVGFTMFVCVCRGFSDMS